MAQSFLRCSALLFLSSVILTPAFVVGALPSEELLPNTTKGYVAIPDLEKLSAAWDKTQLGQMAKDPAMKPFADDLQRQLNAKFSQAGVRLAVTFDDLRGVASGEVAVASLQPGADKARCATVLLADVTGRDVKARQLLDKIGKNLVQKGAVAGTANIGGVVFRSFKLAKRKPTDRTVTAYYVQHADMLIATDDLEVAGGIMKRFSGKHTDTLRSLVAYQHSVEETRKAFTDEPQIRWFVEPFGYIEVLRAYQGGRKKRGTDMLKVLASQGFNAIQGLGGHVAFASNDHELQHQTFIYAPPAKREPGESSPDKYKLAARILDFPNTETLLPQAWVPKRLGTFLTFNWKMQNAFWHTESLVNEIAGDEVFQEVIKSIEIDPNGPRINVKREFVQFLGERATLVSDYREPIDTKSERILFAVEVTDVDSVMATVNKAMKSDPNAKMIMVDGHTIWEMTQEETFAVEEIKIDGADTGSVSEEEAIEEDEEKRFRPNAAVTVAHGHLLLSSHVDYLVDLLKEPAEGDRLTDADEYQRVAAALKQLGAKSDCTRLFTRTGHAYRVTYEMIRQNKMPESESLLGKALNEVFAPEEEDELRENQLDGTKLPPFEQVKRYLGPTGLFVRTEADGWSVSGCLLSEPQ